MVWTWSRAFSLKCSIFLNFRIRFQKKAYWKWGISRKKHVIRFKTATEFSCACFLGNYRYLPSSVHPISKYFILIFNFILVYMKTQMKIVPHVRFQKVTHSIVAYFWAMHKILPATWWNYHPICSHHQFLPKRQKKNSNHLESKSISMILIG